MNSINKHLLAALFLTFFTTTIGCAQEQTNTEPLKLFDWKEMEEAQKLAAENDKKVLVYANAVWCSYCKKMEREVFSIKEVQETTDKYFYPVWVDIESDDKLSFRGREMTQTDFSRAMRVTGTPTFIFIDSKGEIIAGQPGFIPEELYIQILEYVGSDAYQQQLFEEFSNN